MMLKRLIGGAAVAGVAVFGGVNAMGDESKRDASGVITEAGGLGAFAVRVGDCVRLPDAGLVQSVEGVPCAEPHNAQAFAAFDMPDGAFPGDLAVEEAVETGCTVRYEAFSGIAYEESLLGFTALFPTRESWTSANDREIVCLVGSMTDDLVGDLRGSGR